MSTFTLGKTPMPNGTILIMGIRYAGSAASDPDTTRGRTNPRVFTYALLKAGGLWYVTGSGKVPTAAGWPAIERWLARDGREVVSVQVVTETAPVYPSPGAAVPARIVEVLAAQTEQRRADEESIAALRDTYRI